MALTLTTAAEILRRAGQRLNASLVALSASTIVDMGETAEGEFCTETRRDWITDYSTTVNTRVKKKISAAVSARAAMELMSDSQAIFPSVRQKETLFDLNDETYQKAVKTLEQNDANNIRSVNA